MAAVTGAVIGGVAALGGAYQAIQGAKQARDAKDALNNLPIPELQNAYAGMQVSQLGANLQREEGARQFATGVDALRAGGIRGVVGGLPQLNEQQNLQNRQIAANLDEQQKQINMAMAQEEANLRAIREGRYQQDIAALSSQYSAGKQQEMQGIHGAMQGLASGAQMYQQGKYMDTLTSQAQQGNLGVIPKAEGLQPMGTNSQVVSGFNTNIQIPNRTTPSLYGPQQAPDWYNSLTGIDYTQFNR